MNKRFKEWFKNVSCEDFAYDGGSLGAYDFPMCCGAVTFAGFPTGSLKDIIEGIEEDYCSGGYSWTDPTDSYENRQKTMAKKPELERALMAKFKEELKRELRGIKLLTVSILNEHQNVWLSKTFMAEGFKLVHQGFTNPNTRHKLFVYVYDPSKKRKQRGKSLKRGVF